MIGKKTYPFIFSITLLLLLGAAFNSCSTKKNTWTRRAYHNLTCHYNVFWNGLMSMQEGKQNQQEKVKDNYKTILQVYNYGTKEDAKSLFPKMDRTIEKSSIAIQKHSMYFGRKEQVKWVPESYLLMGIAHFYKQDYISARRVFDYIYKEYKDSPIQYEGLLWLAKTYIQMNRAAKAEASLNLLASKMDDDDFPVKVYRELPLVQADLYLSQQNYAAAYPFLERALEINKDRYYINRVLFILGQINQKDGDFKRATYYYNKLIKRNPPYELAFNARLNMAKCYDAESGNSKAITRLLMKMTKESKNKEFLDQIYFALADVAKKDHNDTLAINYLRKSVAASTNNNFQKATSALEVANIYFDKSEYKMAGLYFDTAVSVLPTDFPNYNKIKEKAQILTSVVTQYQTIKEQDSLQHLAKMSDADKYAVIDAVIEKYRIAEEERKKREEEEREAKEAERIESQYRNNFGGMGGRGGPGGPPSLGGGNGKWYFYNPTALSRGYSAFVQNWGKRKLEDNWRLSDKRQMISVAGEDEEEAATDSVASDTSRVASSKATPYDRAYYLDGLPKTDEDFKASDDKIIEAYYKLGSLYKESLHDTASAIQTYQQFIQRFPDNKYRLEVWFALYQLYDGEHDSSNVAKYKSLILSNYPDSDYAKVIIDPDYFAKQAEKKNRIVKFYERTYNAYKNEQYFRVLAYANKAIEQYSDNTAMLPRFLYLKAIALGKITTADSMYSEMKALVTKFPQSEVTPMAKDVLKTLRADYGFDGGDKGNGKDIEVKKASKYKIGDDIPFLVILSVNGNTVKVNPLKIRLSDFNKKYFRLRKLRIKSLQLDNQRVLITIGNFKNKNDAANYYNALRNDEYVLSGLDKHDYSVFPISIQNYPIMYRDKDVKGYLKFMDENLNISD